jgi:MFS transporter, DHA1 family, multidrug resistance protein
MLVSVVTPVLAPLLGGYVSVWLGWRAIFLLFALLGSGCLLAVHFGLRESLPVASRTALSLRNTVSAYVRLLADPTFVGFTLCLSASYAGLFVYVACAPFVFINIFHLPPQHFGLLFGANAIFLIGAAQISGRLVRRVSPATILRYALWAQAAAGLVLVGVWTTGTGGAFGVGAFLAAYLACMGFVIPNAVALAMSSKGHAAGAASALLGAVQFSAGAVGAMAVSATRNAALPSMILGIATAGVLGLLAYLLLIRRGPVPQTVTV